MSLVLRAAAASPLTETIELPPLALGGATAGAVAHGRRWAVVHHALGRRGCTHPLVDHPGHLEHAFVAVDRGRHAVAHGHAGRRLRGSSVHSHVPALTRRSSRGTRGIQAYRPQPPIDAGRLHGPHRGTGSTMRSSSFGPDGPREWGAAC